MPRGGDEGGGQMPFLSDRSHSTLHQFSLCICCGFISSSKEFTKIVQFFSTYKPICVEMLILSDKFVPVWIFSRKSLVYHNPGDRNPGDNPGLGESLGHSNLQGLTRHANALQLPEVKGAAGIDWSATTVTLISVVIVFFRYYIREPVVKKKLPCKFPLTKPTLELLEKVTNYVLNKSMIKQPSFR